MNKAELFNLIELMIEQMNHASFALYEHDNFETLMPRKEYDHFIHHLKGWNEELERVNEAKQEIEAENWEMEEFYEAFHDVYFKMINAWRCQHKYIFHTMFYLKLFNVDELFIFRNYLRIIDTLLGVISSECPKRVD